MQWMVISLLVLAICELPVLHGKKVVFVVPRQLRRSPSAPLRHMMMMMHAKTHNFPEHGFPGPRHPGYPPGGQYYRPKGLHFARDQYPQGGDDFDQGHEEVNNVIVPHGKGISHAVSFGKGYIPFESYKDHRASNSHHHDYRLEAPTAQDVQYSPAINTQIVPSYAQAYITQQADSYVNHADSSHNELQDRIHERGAQKQVAAISPHHSPNAGPIGSHYAVVQSARGLPGKPGVYLPSGNPQATLGAGKQGIVLSDSIILDDYHRKVAEFTKNWPSSFSGTNFVPGTIGPGTSHQGSLPQFGTSRQFDGNNSLQGYSGGTSFVSNLSQDQTQRGYAVKEDVVDTPHDFRTMPIQTAPVQPHQSPLQQIVQQQQQQQRPQPVPQIIQHQQPVQQILRQQQQPLPQIIHQQPVQQTLQQIFPQSQVPVNYALPNYQAYIHG